jgi:hypothetical protein
MASNLDKYKADLKRLTELGDTFDADLMLRSFGSTGDLDDEHKNFAKKIKGSFERRYQDWYTEATSVIRQLIPDRLGEFESLYKGEPRRKEINSTSYNIQDWLNGVRAGTKYTGERYYDDFAIISMRFRTQLAILKSVSARFESSLFDIRQLVQADLFDSELDAATELLKHGFLRAGGAIAGVVLEKHLGQVADNHDAKTRKKHPTISDLNDLLKANGVIDVPVWRQIQRLGDLRNLCDHNKEREPTSEEVDELVGGVGKISKTLF